MMTYKICEFKSMLSIQLWHYVTLADISKPFIRPKSLTLSLTQHAIKQLRPL